MATMSQRSRIYSTDKGAVIVESKTKNDIIDLLKDGDRTGSEIRKELGKAKSTVSVHLSDLKDLGIIDKREHPEDERKKIFHLTSQFLGRPEIPNDHHYKELIKNLEEPEIDEYGLLKWLFHLVRHGVDSFGLDIHPALKEIGRDAGKALGKNFSSENREDLLDEIAEFWKKKELGVMEVNDNTELLVKDCFDCAGMPEVGHTLCSLDEGMLEGIIEERLDQEVKVEEIECHGSGEEHCKFVIEWS